MKRDDQLAYSAGAVAFCVAAGVVVLVVAVIIKGFGYEI